MRSAIILSLLTTAFGVAILHFNEATGVARHTAFAERHELPAPSHTSWVVGAVITVVGATWLGYTLGRRKTTRAQPATLHPESNP